MVRGERRRRAALRRGIGLRRRRRGGVVAAGRELQRAGEEDGSSHAPLASQRAFQRDPLLKRRLPAPRRQRADAGGAPFSS
jgi:hypothetical protein